MVRQCQVPGESVAEMMILRGKSTIIERQSHPAVMKSAAEKPDAKTMSVYCDLTILQRTQKIVHAERILHRIEAIAPAGMTGVGMIIETILR
jgi:hypothetical protein